MKSWNQESRALKLDYDLKRARLNHDFNTLQVELTHELDLARNELHYCHQSLRQSGGDPEAVKARLDAAAERIREISQRKVLADYQRKNELVKLDRERDAALSALEEKYGKEVAV